MAFKTGKTFTLTASGTTAGNFSGAQFPDRGSVNFTYGLPGASVALDIHVLSDTSNPPPVTGNISASAQTSTVISSFPGGTTKPYPVSFVGAWSLSVDVEEWVNIVWDDQTIDANTGVYNPVPTCSVVVYIATKIGGTAAASISCLGLTANASGAITSSVVVTPVASLSASLQNNIGSGSGGRDKYLTHGNYSFSSNYTCNLGLGMPALTQAISSDSSSSSASVSASSLSIACNPNSHAGGGVTVAAYATASVTATIFPKKNYSMSGEIFSVDSSYPGTVPITFSKYAGDPAPTLTGPGFGAAYGQQSYTATCKSHSDSIHETGFNPATDILTGGDSNGSQSKNEFQALSASVASSFCDANDEFVTYTNIGGAQVKLYNNAIYLMGYQTGGIVLSLTSPFNVDPGNSLSGWTGSALGGAGIGNSGTGSMTRTFTPFFDMSGYRYLRITGAVTTSGSPQNRVVTIGAKTWNVTFPTVASDIFIDLCNPHTGGADTDTTDTIWTDTNPTLVYGADSGTSVSAGPGDGPLWGVTYCTSLALSGFGASTESFASLDLVIKTEAFGHFMCQWEPRFDNLVIQGPDWSVPAVGGGDTVFTRGVIRGFILITDGRQSAEYRPYSLLRTEGGSSGITFYGVTNYSIASMASSVNLGIQIDGGPVGSDANYFNYAVKPNGWSATVVAAAPDGSNNVNAGFLNNNLPATWVCYGVKYSSAGFASTVGLAGGGSPGCQMLMSSLDFYPGCADVFGLGGGSPTANTIYLGASKIYRAQSHGITLNRTSETPAPSSGATLYPGPGEVQPTGAAVGSATSDSPQGVYRTVGDGLDGFNAVTVGPTTIVSDNIGIVTARNGSGAPQSLSITVGEAKLSRAAFRLPVAVAAIIRPDNLGHTDGSYHRVSGVYDMSGAPAGIAYWRCDTGAPRTSGDWTIAAVPISADPTDANPSICIDHWGRVWCRWQRTAGVYVSFSDDDGVSWSTPTLAIANGLYPVNETGHDGSIYIAAYVDDGTSMSTGTIQGQWQYPGDQVPSSLVTLRKWNGSALVNIAVQLGSFSLAPLMAVHGGWMLTCVEVGASATTDYISYDDADGTFTATGV